MNIRKYVKENELEQALGVLGRVVYYLRRYDSLIKIGKTINLRNRTRAHEQTYGALDFLCSESGYTEKEKERHLQFADLRCGRTEWFQPGEALELHIKQLQDGMTFAGEQDVQ